jgi:hypothetical protein
MNSEFALLQHARRLGLDLWIHPETRSVLLDGLSYPSAKHALDYIYRMDLVQPEQEELLPPLEASSCLAFTTCYLARARRSFFGPIQRVQPARSYIQKLVVQKLKSLIFLDPF